MICQACGEPCEPITVDYGYGWTQRGSEWQNDVRLSVVSDCCDADMEDDDED